LNRGRIVSAALNIADDEGLTGVSMRRLAADLGVTTMALYRYVSSRDHLILLMADAAFGEFPLSEPPPPHWRDQLEAAAQLQWSMYQRHPWLAQITSFTRPLLTPQAMAHSEWVMRTMDGLDFSPATAIHVHVTLAAYVRGLAANLEPEADAMARSGIHEEEWMDAYGTPALGRVAGGQPAFPLLALIPPRSLNLDTLFDFGLQRLLDGIALLPGATSTKTGFQTGSKGTREGPGC
jgi:AcrR family transcriptional regulator